MRTEVNRNITVKIKELSKSYGNILAVDNLNLSIEKGELFGFIGPDGAGKTTIFRILTTLLLPDKGNVDICNMDVVREFKKIRNIIGYMPGKFSLYHDLSVIENLTFFATIFGCEVEDNYHLINDIYIQLEPFKNRKAGKLSGGMKQKLALCCAMIHKPEVLILDEPTTGVDAVSRKEFWVMLKKLKKSGITILVSTPYMDEAALCDRVALIQEGKILTTDKPSTITDKFQKKIFAVKSLDMFSLINVLKKWENIESAYLFGQYVHVKLINNKPDEMENFLLINNQENIEINPVTAVIEDVFMSLMEQNNEIQ